jgi:hypothetical protein
VVAVLFGAAVPGESLSLRVLAGMVVGLTGVGLVLVAASVPRRSTTRCSVGAGLRLTRMVPSTGMRSFVEAVPDSLS